MDERNFALDQTANEDIFRVGHGLKDGEDVMTFRMSPPASFPVRVDRRARPISGAFYRQDD